MILWLGIFALPAAAQTPSVPGTPSAGGLVEPTSIALAKPNRDFDDLIALWGKRKLALAANDHGRVDDLMDRLETAGREIGLARLSPFAMAAVAEGYVALADGDVERARTLSKQGERLDRHLPALHDLNASIAAKEAWWGLHTLVKHKSKALMASLSDFRRATLLGSDLLLTWMMILALLALIFAVTQGIRYALHVFHDLGHAFPSGVRALLMTSLGAIALMPLLYGFGPLLLFFPLAALLWCYQSRGERVLSIVFVLLLGGTPWLLRAVDRLMDAGTGTPQALHALENDPTDKHALVDVARAAKNNADWQAQAVLGAAYKRLGRLSEAEIELRKALDGAPAGSDARGMVHNTLGNVLFAKGKAQLALNAYARAGELLPSSAAPYFNQHRLHDRMKNGPEAQAALVKASDINAQQVATWAADEKASVNRYVADVAFPRTVLAARALDGLFSPTSLSRQTWVALAGPLPEAVAPVGAALCLVLFLALTGIGRRLELAWPCMRCGASARFMVGEGQPIEPNCQECTNIFLRNHPIDRRIRFAKDERIARVQAYRRWGARLAGLTLPGVADLIHGATGRGILMAGLSVLVIMRYFQPSGILFEPGTLPATEISTQYPWLSVGLLLWVSSVRSVFLRTKEAV